MFHPNKERKEKIFNTHSCKTLGIENFLRNYSQDNIILIIKIFSITTETEKC